MSHAVQGDPMIGEIVNGKFRVLEAIGKGATGFVYRAENVALGNIVALKVLHVHRQNERRLIERFEREARATSKLNHPNCIQVLDYGTDQSGQKYMAMEYVHGTLLQDEIDRTAPMPMRRVVRIVTQVLGALDEAHANGIIHCDLKPENIILEERAGERDFVKVLDFGVAEQDDATKGTRQVAGTPEYMSPEQARGDKLDGRSDLYAVGVMLYQMVTGEVPFRGVSPLAIVTRHLNEEVEPPTVRRPDADIKPELERLILRCLAKERERRPESAAVLSKELTELLPIGSVDTTGRVTVEAIRDKSRRARAKERGAGKASKQPRRQRIGSQDATRQVQAMPDEGGRKRFVMIAAGSALLLLVVVALLVGLLAGGEEETASGEEAPEKEAATASEAGEEASTGETAPNTTLPPEKVVEEAAAVVEDPPPEDKEETDDLEMDFCADPDAMEEQAAAEDKAKDDEEAAEEEEDDERKKDHRKKRRERDSVDPLTKRMLASAEKSLREGNIENAKRLVQRVLDRDPGNKTAKRLKRKIEKLQ